MSDWKLSDAERYRHVTPDRGDEVVSTDVAGPLTGTQPPAMGRRAAPQRTLPDLRRRSEPAPAAGGVRWGRWIAAAGVSILGGLGLVGAGLVALYVGLS